MVGDDRPTAPPEAPRSHDGDPFGALPPGAQVGKYQIVEMLGQGGFGITYRAHDSRLHRDVALKEYLPTSFARRQGSTTVVPRSTQTAEDFLWGRERFLDEARTLARLEDAPGIVNVHDFLEDNGTAYMVMALVRGETLEARLKRDRRLQQPAIEQLLYPLLDGLEIVHDSGFLHRDIKPANILIDNAGRPTLIDFGASRVALLGRTQAMTAVYTPGYAAPEQMTSAKQGPWTDIYAVAGTLYHCVTGRTPPSAMERATGDDLVSAAEAGKSRYAPSLLAAIDAGLKLKAADRPQTVADWRRVLSGLSPTHGEAPTGPATREMDDPTRKIEESTSRHARRSRLAWVAAGIVALAAAGAGAWTMLGPRPETTTEALRRAEAEAQRHAALVAKLRQEEEERQRAAAEATLKAEQEAARKAAEEKAAAEAAARRQTEEAERERAAAEAARRKADEEAARKAAEEKASAEALARRKAEEEEAARVAAEATRRRAEEQARVEAEARGKVEREAAERRAAEEKAAAEAEARRKAEQEAAARKAAEEKAAAEAAVKRKADEDAARRAADEKAAAEAARRQAEERARVEAEARRKAEQETAARKAAEERAAAEAEVKRRAEEEAARKAAEERAAADAVRRRAEEQARVEAEARRKAEQEAAARKAVEEKAAAEAEARRRADAEAARRAADEAATAEAARRRAEEQARAEAEERRKTEEEAARKAAEDKARTEADARRQGEAAEAALRLGDRDRKHVQVALTSLGYDTRGADGSLGPRTRQMIAAWQKKQGMPETGYLTGPQVAALRQQAAPALARYDEEQKKLEEDKRKADDEARRKADEEAKRRAEQQTKPAPATPTPAPPAQAPPSVAATPSAPAGGAADGLWFGALDCPGYGRRSLQVQMARGQGRFSDASVQVSVSLQGDRGTARVQMVATDGSSRDAVGDLSGTLKGRGFFAQGSIRVGGGQAYSCTMTLVAP